MLGGRLIKPLARAILGERYILAQSLWRQWCRHQHYYKTLIGVASVRRLRRFKDIHKGERCVIIGNGPSLRRMDLAFLSKETTFGLNRIYLLTEELNFDISYLVVSAPLVMEQFAKEIQNRVSCHKFVAFSGRKYFAPDDSLSFFDELRGSAFSDDATYGLYGGHTVTYAAMQIAFYMGFEEIVLIGVDHNFVSKGQPNSEAVMETPDPNHFSPIYFGEGVRWQLPDLESSEIAYRIAKVAFERNGRRILDATVGGKLTVFPKVDYRAYFALGSSITSE